MNSRVVYIIICLIGIWTASANADPVSFHAPAFFGLKGPVKEVVRSADSAITSSVENGNMKFNEEGKLMGEGCEYDENGFIIRFVPKVDNLGLERVVRPVYDANGTPVKYITELTEPMGIEITLTNEFDADGNVVGYSTSQRLMDEKLATVIPLDKMPTMLTVYSDIEHDDHGNWTKRIATVKLINETPFPIDPDTLVSTEERTVLYYE